MLELQSPPDYFGQFMAPLQRQQALNIEQQQANLQQQELQAKLAKARQDAATLHQYQLDTASVIASPTPEGFRTLMLKYPDMHEGLKDAWDSYGEGERQRDTSAASQVYAALANGQPEVAAKLLRDRKEALTGAGKDDKLTDSLIDLVESGDPTKIKQAQGMAGFMLATATGPDKIGPMLEALGSNGKNDFTLDAGATRYSGEDGHVIAQSPFLKGADGAIYERDGPPTGSGTGGAAPTGGAEAAIAHALKHEGGYLAKDGNGYPTNFGINAKANGAELNKLKIADLRTMTKAQAIQIYKDKYWPASGAAALPANLQAPYFDVYIRSPTAAKKLLADSGGDPIKFVQSAQNLFTNLVKNNPDKYGRFAKAWKARDADNLAYAQSGDTETAAAGTAQPGTAPSGFHVLIPGSSSVPSGFEPDPTRPGALRPIPGGPADKPGSEPPGDQELSDAATQYLLTGQMPALGNGGAGLKSQILAKRSVLMKQLGISAEELPAYQAQYKADQTALVENGKLLNNLQSSENALKANAQQVWNTHHQLVQDGIISDNPWITRKKLAYYQQFGSPDEKAHVKTYLDAVNAYSTEYSKFMTAANGMGGSAAPSDSARQQAGELNDPGLAATPLLGHLRQGLTEAINKRNGVAQQNQALHQKLSSYLHPHGDGEGAKPAPTKNDDGWITLPSGLKIRRIR